MDGGTIVVQVALEYPAGWTERERESERRHRERMATIQAETEARVLAQAVNYPTAFEIRVEALRAAAIVSAQSFSRVQEDPAELDSEAVMLVNLASYLEDCYLRGDDVPTAPPHDDGEYQRTVSSRIDD